MNLSKNTLCPSKDPHPHVHGPNCGHQMVEHDDHIDYVHDGHFHRVHNDHIDECSGPEEC